MNQNPPNPNTILSALLDVASAAYALNHSLEDSYTVGAQMDMRVLREKLAVLEALPQPEGEPPLTGSAKARHYMQSFLEGQPVGNVVKLRMSAKIGAVTNMLADSADKAHKIWNDALLLDQLRMICGYIENGGGELVTIYQDDATRDWTLTVGFESRFGQQRRRYTSTSFHQVIREAAKHEIEYEECQFCGMVVEFPCDEPPPDTCSKALDAMAEQRRVEIKEKMMTTARIERNPTGDSHIDMHFPDPSGGDVIPLAQERVKSFAPTAPKPEQVARDAMNKLLIEVKDEINADAAKRIIRNVGGAPIMANIPDVLVAAVTQSARDMLNEARRPSKTAREEMKALLFELATTYGNRIAKKIILDVGGAYRMINIPDNKVNAVTIAARDRLALERRLAELWAIGDTDGVASLLYGTQGKTDLSPEESEKRLRGAGAPVKEFDLPPPIFPERADPVEPTRSDDSALGEQGGTFDGGGASGDWS